MIREKRKNFRKFGIFESEKSIALEVWKETWLQEALRHPFAYVMEACDDIAYSVIDAEDTVKKGYASFYDLMDFLESTSDDNAVVREAICASRKKNDEFKKEGLSSRELNDISMQMFRVKAISLMVVSATEVFVSSVDKMLAGETDPEFQLIKHSSCATLCDALKRFDRQHGFHHSEVLRLELKGNNYIKGIMDLFCGIQSVNPTRTETHMRDMHMASSRRTIAGCTKARRKRTMDQNVCYVMPFLE